MKERWKKDSGLYEMPQYEIARETGWSQPVVSRLEQTGLQKLRTLLGEYEYHSHPIPIYDPAYTAYFRGCDPDIEYFRNECIDAYRKQYETWI